MSQQDDQRAGDEPERQNAPFSFTDKRKVTSDGTSTAPQDGAAEAPTAQPDAADEQGAAGDGEVDDLSAEAGRLYESSVAEADQLRERVAELEEELKREQAEYVNSRRRIQQNAEVSKQNAVANVLNSVLGVMDDIELARQHGDLPEGTPFASIAAKLESALAQHGLQRFGKEGEEFDPQMHEALMHEDQEGAESTTLKVVMQPGYRMNERVLRPARVGTQG
ncbi:nucleotide exchange factor GrpE [Helcobacillus massiliensis]|uniref:nucleotide exchange factor GrpE n=1 Tax=Helcobacillus massiliensis TaxID=521392 RepID=UPI00255655B2|nr:nucleotide exchange factor GrpE [Helcobacillus massiliensis]MDK7742947.1 nucleotide exchange factor GrpE [Helcobacillus massiliensis]WOO92060.1 nucleotide exchange factor GrpE [Helcobacillus massiliensis]